MIAQDRQIPGGTQVARNLGLDWNALVGRARCRECRQHRQLLGDDQLAHDAVGAPLGLRPAGVKPHPVGIRVERQYGECGAMASDQRQVVVQARIQRPDPARRVADAVVAVEKVPQARDRAVEVATDRAVQVGRAGQRRQVADVALDPARDVGFGSPRKSIDAVHPANHTHVSQQIALEVGEGIPVAQDLRVIRAAPHEVGGLELTRQQLRA